MEYALQETAYLFETAGTAVWSGLRRAGQHLLDHIIPHHRNNYHPHLLGHRTLALFSILLVTVKIVVVASVLFETPQTTEASAITVNNVITLANQSRIDNGLKALTSNAQLASAAQAKANDMLARQYFAHNTPTGETPWSFIKAAGYQYLKAGENLAVDFTEAESVETAWMNSPGHRANILDKDFIEIGVGISQGLFEGHQSIFVVQMFGTPAEQPITVQDSPTPVEKPVAVAPAPAPVAVAPVPVPAPTSASRFSSRKASAAAPAPALTPVAVVHAESSAQAVPSDSSAPPQELKIIDANAKPSGDNVLITVHTSSLASRVIVQYGGAAIMLDPYVGSVQPGSGSSDAAAGANVPAGATAPDSTMLDSEWQGTIPLARVAGSESTLMVQAYDMSGNMKQQQLASFSDSTASNFGSKLAIGQPNSLFNMAGAKSINFLGANVNVKDFQTKFYLIFIAGVLAALILAIGIKRHVQHLSLVANSSFVVVLALFLWMAG